MATPPPTPPTPPTARTRIDRRLGRRTKRRVLIGGAAVVALLGAAGAYWFTYDTKASPAAKYAPITTTTTAPLPTSATLVATTKVPELVVYPEPATGGSPVTKLTDRTEYGLPRTLMVVEQQPGWLKTLLPIRPNGSIGWVKEADVTLSTTTVRIEIDLRNRYLRLIDGEQVLLDGAVGIGKDETPTPPGTYYITDPVDLTSRPDGTYGAFALGISGYSEVLKTFRGGPGQLAVHGTGNLSDLGQKVSNGCIRIPNDKIVEIAKRVPLGAPVIITA